MARGLYTPVPWNSRPIVARANLPAGGPEALAPYGRPGQGAKRAESGRTGAALGLCAEALWGVPALAKLAAAFPLPTLLLTLLLTFRLTSLLTLLPTLHTALYAHTMLCAVCSVQYAGDGNNTYAVRFNGNGRQKLDRLMLALGCPQGVLNPSPLSLYSGPELRAIANSRNTMKSGRNLYFYPG
jgi:hypothetical protein